jgi:hypothetical protein
MRFWSGDDDGAVLGLSGKHSDSCDHDSLAASTFECRAGSGRAWTGKCGRGGEDCTNIVCMNVAMVVVDDDVYYVLSLVQLLAVSPHSVSR